MDPLFGLQIRDSTYADIPDSIQVLVIFLFCLITIEIINYKFRQICNCCQAHADFSPRDGGQSKGASADIKLQSCVSRPTAKTPRHRWAGAVTGCRIRAETRTRGREGSLREGCALVIEATLPERIFYVDHPVDVISDIRHAVTHAAHHSAGLHHRLMRLMAAEHRPRIWISWSVMQEVI
jgi:hypothetical protein